MSDLILIAKENNIPDTEAQSLEKTFTPFFQKAAEWKAAAEKIKVNSIEDIDQMEKASEARKALKKIRCEVDTKRKELKEESLRKGKAIDGMANIIKFLIIPIEEDLEKKEKFIKLEQERIAREKFEERQGELALYEADTEFIRLEEMDEESYQAFLSRAKESFAEKKKREAEEEKARIEKEKARIEKEKEEAAERERIRIENEKLKAELERKKKEGEAARKKQEAEEAARIKAEKEARLAPEKKKLEDLAVRIVQVEIPEVKSEEAKKVISGVVELLNKTSSYIKSNCINL